jgi:two-component system CheB/CheR fusion protein
MKKTTKFPSASTAKKQRHTNTALRSPRPQKASKLNNTTTKNDVPNVATSKGGTGKVAGKIPFPVVGIGASAGGFGALGELQAGMPTNTAFKQAKAAVRNSEKQLKLFIQDAPVALAMFDRDMRYIVASRRWAADYGLVGKELPGRLHYDVFPEISERIKEFHRRGIAGEVIREETDLFRRADGSEKWLRWQMQPWHDSNGAVGGILIFSEDITAREQAEQQLKALNAKLERRVAERTAELTKSNKRLHAIMDNAQIGIISVDLLGNIGLANPAALRIFGYDSGELPGMKLSRLIDLPDQTQNQASASTSPQNQIQELADGQREVQGRRKDGSLLMVELSMVASNHGRKRQFVVMVNDITGRKQLERELLEVAEIERQSLGHDLHDSLGQQLHAISYMVAIFRDELRKQSPAMAHRASRLVKHLDHAIELTRGLARGLQPVVPEPEGLMQTLREFARRTRGVYRVDCRFECHSSVLIHRHSAASHLFRIAQEAVNNALKHGKATQIRIQLAATAHRIVLQIRNNGKGIRHSSKGTRGLGLHIMRHRTDAIRGSLTVKNLPEGGTEVVCTVPRQELIPPNA